MRTNTRKIKQSCTEPNRLATVWSGALLLLLICLTTFKASAVDDADWSGLGAGLGAPVYALAVAGTNLYAGGSFTNAGGVSAKYVAKWDGSAWSALGSGLDGPVYALAVDGTDLYVGGSFTNAGGIAANRIAKWHGSYWEAMGLGMDGPVYAVDASAGTIYAGGSFTTADGVVVNNVAKWQGTWTPMRSPAGDCYAPGVYGGSVYAIKNGIVAGSFTGVCGFAPMPSIVTWNGSNWGSIDSGLSGSVYAVAYAGSYSFYGGYFLTTRNSYTLKNIARFDGSSWYGGWYYAPNDAVYALAASGSNIFMGGAFTTANLMTLNHIARFDTVFGLWALGSGVNGTVHALAADRPGHLFVGGEFTVAGTNFCSYIAQVNIPELGFPSITKQPQSSTNGVGTDAHFSVSALGQSPLGYQWFKGVSALNDAGNIFGARSSALTLSNVFAADAGGYFVIITNGYGSVTSQIATLTVLDPFITTQPASRFTNSEASVQFNVVAVGTPPFSHQWFKGGTSLTDGGNIWGAQTAILTLTNVLGGDAGGYSVRITNVYGSITSQVATLTVVDPFIVTQPGSRSTNAGASIQFNVVAVGTAPFSYQWLKGGTTLNDGGNISGAQTAMLTLNNLLGGDAGCYSVIVTNGYGSVTSQVATLTVVNLWTEADLRAAMAGGGTVTFPSDGTIALGNTISVTADTVLDGTGHQVTISGGGSTRVFSVNTNVVFTLLNLTIADGRSDTGGGVYNLGILNASRCVFRGNNAAGGIGSNGVDGSYVSAPGAGRPGGSAFGGAIYNLGTMLIERSLFVSNNATGGAGGHGGDGNLLTFYPCPDQSGGNGSQGGDGLGSALFNAGGTATVVNCTFAANTAAGGVGGRGGYGGLINWNPHSASGCRGGNGGNGGSASGMTDGLGGQCYLTNCTIAANTALAGAGGERGGGSLGQPSGLPGSDGGAWCGVVGTLVNTVLASNVPGTNTFPDAKLGPLADNGGPTLTMALLPGSPAIDAGDSSAAPFCDQRGFPRPAGSAADIGAFEYGSMLPVLSITHSGPGQLSILAQGNTNQWCRLLVSTNLSLWSPIATNQFGADGKFLFYDNLASTGRFYRVAMP
jgi:Immunoglobulin I-set domain